MSKKKYNADGIIDRAVQQYVVKFTMRSHNLKGAAIVRSLIENFVLRFSVYLLKHRQVQPVASAGRGRVGAPRGSRASFESLLICSPPN